MDRTKLNYFADALLDTLTEEGLPESYLYIAAESAGLPAGEAIDTLVVLELLRRENQLIKPGPKWALAVEARKRFYSKKEER